MRVMVVRPGPRFSVADVCAGWVEALQELGCGVVDYNFDDRLDFFDAALGASGGGKDFQDVVRMAAHSLRADVYDFWPDVILVVSGFFTPPALLTHLRSRGHKVVLLATESPYEDDHQLELAPWCDLVVLNDPTNLDLFREHTNAVYLPHAYRPKVHHPKPATPGCESDFCFVGTGYPSRVEFFEQVDWSGIDAAFAGNWQHTTPASPLRKFLAHDINHCCDNTRAVDLYTSTKVSANLYRVEAQRPELAHGWAMGPREVELAACGTFYLTQPRGENREVLPMLPTFVGPDEFGEQLRWWLSHDKEREKAAGEAREAVADRTFTNHARKLLGLLT